jgi:hypothetical protein
MKPSLIGLCLLLAVLAAAYGGFSWHQNVQEDRGHYHYGFYRGEIARITSGEPSADDSDPILRDERARRLFEEGYADALSHSPPRYPYAPLRIDPRIFAPDANN